MWYSAEMDLERATADGAARPRFDARALADWAARHRLDPALVDIDEDGFPNCERLTMPTGELQNDQMAYLEPALRDRYAHRADVYVGNDRLVNGADWPMVSAAPDLMVAFGAAPHRRAGGKPRRSYNLALSGNPPPTFVLEILSERTKDNDLKGKPPRYAAMGVAEYWLFDPEFRDIPSGIAAHVLRDGRYEPLAPSADGSFRSAALGVDFRVAGDDLRMRDATTGEELLGYDEQREAKEHAMRVAERERQAKESERRAKERALQIAERRHEAKEQANAKMERALETAERERLARQRAERELERLRGLADNASRE